MSKQKKENNHAESNPRSKISYDTSNLQRLLKQIIFEQKQLAREGCPAARMTWAIASGFLAVLEEGYLLSDLDMFKEHPLYTGARFEGG